MRTIDAHQTYVVVSTVSRGVPPAEKYAGCKNERWRSIAQLNVCDWGRVCPVGCVEQVVDC